MGNNDIDGRARKLPVYSIDFVGDVVFDVVNEWSSLESGRSGDIPRVVADRGSGRRDGRGRAEGLTERVKDSVSSMIVRRQRRLQCCRQRTRGL